MDTSIGNKIKSLRLANKMSQKELCGSYMNRVVLSRIENNKMLPSFPQVEYIANKLGKTTDYFLLTVNYCAEIKSKVDLQSGSVLEEMYNKKMYYNIVKFQEEETATDADRTSDYNEDFYLGMSYFNLDMPFKAIKPLKRYINKYQTSPSEIQKSNIINFSNALNTLFKIMLKNKNYTKCETYLLTAKKYILLYDIDNLPISFIVHNNLAYLYLKQNRYNDIIKLLNFFVDTHKDIQHIFITSSIYLCLNIAYYNLGEYSKSIQCAKKAIYLYLYNDKYNDAGESYINYINALRYSSNFCEASDILEQCLKDYKDYTGLYNRFLVQKMIIKFNMDHYDEVLSIAEDIDIAYLPKDSKCDYYFMTGHIEYLNSNNKKAFQYLLKCEKYFKKRNYNKDLYVLYKDLYGMTNEEHYKVEYEKYRDLQQNRKNIIS